MENVLNLLVKKMVEGVSDTDDDDDGAKHRSEEDIFARQFVSEDETTKERSQEPVDDVEDVFTRQFVNEDKTTRDRSPQSFEDVFARQFDATKEATHDDRTQEVDDKTKCEVESGMGTHEKMHHASSAKVPNPQVEVQEEQEGLKDAPTRFSKVRQMMTQLATKIQQFDGSADEGDVKKTRGRGRSRGRGRGKGKGKGKGVEPATTASTSAAPVEKSVTEVSKLG